MAYIDFRKLKARVPITAILRHYGLLDALEETRHGFEGTCPFCGCGALKVNTEKNVWFCFGDCREHAEEKVEGRGAPNGGNILDFVARQEGVSVKSAAAKIDAWFPKDGAKAEKESETSKPSTSAPAPNTEEATDEGQGARAASAPETVSVEPPQEREQVWEGLRNRPLDFTLKSITLEHPALTALGIERKTLTAFGVGYFTGKGMMHEKVVIPFHGAEGPLVAYAGYSPESQAYTYPKGFDLRLELYNIVRASDVGLGEGLVLVTDLLDVLRLYELGIRHAVALPTATIFPPQLVLLHDLVGDAGCIDFAPRAPECVDTLAALLPHFHVRLHRNTKTSADEFITDVVRALGW